MSALITWICRADHVDIDRGEYLPCVTLHQGQWAYCPQGGCSDDTDHTWNAIDPASIEMLRAGPHASEGSAHEEVRAQ